MIVLRALPKRILVESRKYKRTYFFRLFILFIQVEYLNIKAYRLQYRLIYLIISPNSAIIPIDFLTNRCQTPHLYTVSSENLDHC